MKYFLITWTSSTHYDPDLDQKYTYAWSDQSLQEARNNWAGWNRSKTILKIEEITEQDWKKFHQMQ